MCGACNVVVGGGLRVRRFLAKRYMMASVILAKTFSDVLSGHAFDVIANDKTKSFIIAKKTFAYMGLNKGSFFTWPNDCVSKEKCRLKWPVSTARVEEGKQDGDYDCIE